jgi:hypothetical protein
MKRILAIAFALLTLGLVMPAEAKTTANSNEIATVAANAAPQWQRHRRWERRENRRYDRRYNTRAVTRSRIVRVGRRVYRETYVVRYFPNGRVDTRLISRTRIS